MPKKLDHPIRLARQRRGITQSALARDVGITRSAITALEEGRNRMPKPETLNRFGAALGIPPVELHAELLSWLAAEEKIVLSTRARATLQLEPRHIAHYPTFAAWREQIVDSPTALASLLRVNGEVVRRYEAGRNKGGMSDRLSSALLNVLGVSDGYLAAVQKLPVG